MSLIMKLPAIINESRRIYKEIMDGEHKTANAEFIATEVINKRQQAAGSCSDSILARGDNIPFMKYLTDQKGLRNRINLIYIDPPFFSKTDYGSEIKLKSDKINKIPIMKQNAYHDTWENGMEEYLKMLAVRLLMMKDLLAEDGSIWIHLDWHAVHYVKVIMDDIFGEKNFINEIIWHYKSGGVSKRSFAKKHDTLLFYSKSQKYYFQAHREKSYNRGHKPYRFKGVKEYRDELGWYTMVNRKDVWQLDMVGRTSAERTGYVTQKPESLIERILDSCTREGDLCADFFGGSGTMAAAANKAGRRWISCDIGRLATINAQKRLVNAGAVFSLIEQTDETDAVVQGRIAADISLQASAVSDKMLMRIELTGYDPGSIENIPVETKYLSIIREIIRNDSLQLVDYWSADLKREDGLFQPDVYFCKEHDKIDTSFETIGSDFGPVSIKVVDIFGNCTFLNTEV